MAKKPSAEAQSSLFADGNNKPVDMIDLQDLELDPENPRFGTHDGRRKDQTDILDTIVGDYGIEDVISSLAVNGYFPAEPVIGIKSKSGKKFRIVEGNRRLAACLVLAGDERAKNQPKRTESYQKLQLQHHQPPIKKIPVIWFNEGESPKELISYLGVRHLAASMPWDSYAKAAWIAQVVDEGQLSLEDISRMTGDVNRTISRLLHGFYVVSQLVQEGKFNPEAAVKKGRGSNADFAFSWVYTLLGYPYVRKWLGISDVPCPNPIPQERLNDAGTAFVRLLGNRNAKHGNPAIDDSRQISQYAAALIDKERFELLQDGYTLEEIDTALQPTNERIEESMKDAEKALTALLNLIGKSPPTSIQASNWLPRVITLRNLTTVVQHTIMKAMDVDGSRDDGQS